MPFKELDFRSLEFKNNLDNLPNSLVTLKLFLSSNYTHTLSNLPNSIKWLEINYYLLDNFKRMPSSLKTIIIDIIGGKMKSCDEIKIYSREKINAMYKNNMTKPEIRFVANK